MQVEVDVLELKEADADSRGRITLGSEYAEKTVKVAVVGAKEE